MPLDQHVPIALPAAKLRHVCDVTQLTFRTTADLEPVDELIGQARAVDAIGFGAKIDCQGFNVFALGPPRSGRHLAVRALLEAKAASEPIPADWIYVHNFKSPHQPKAIQLQSGAGSKFKNAMAGLIDDLSLAIPSIFESEDYRNRRKAIEDSIEEIHEKSLNELRLKAEADNIAILRTPMGFALAPTSGGQVLKPEVFNALPEAERDAIGQKIALLQKDLEQILRAVPRHEKDRRNRIKKLNAELAEIVVGQEISEITDKFPGNAEIASYVNDVRSDIIANIEVFLKSSEGDEERPIDAGPSANHRHPKFMRYAVNLVVTHCPDEQAACGAPVVSEEHPTLSNLVGRIEHRSIMGALVTDFTMIMAGALHRANGGYLVLDALKVLFEPFAWESLKRCLRNKVIRISSAGEELSLISTISIEPDPIPLSLKVVLVGDRMLYYLLASLDPEFADLFKVQADFEDVTERSPESVQLLARLAGTIARREKLLPLTSEATARLVEEASREAEDNERLSLRIGVLADIMREASFWAKEAKHEAVTLADFDQALTQRRKRSERLRDRSLETITRGTMFIDTMGAVVGQINGLSVLSIGNLTFGKPTRITARVRMGAGKVIDIEREVELGGPVHSKGVLILSSFLASRYALSAPMSLWASLVFEQSYGGVEGDSASSAELYALLSALAQVPIKQSFAVTGSVNQLGQIQAIGGVNEKIEGFFDVCQARGLTGEQGVLIPEANIKHLMLRPDVVEAANSGRFKVYAVSTIDQGIEILTGMTAGTRDADDKFPEKTINALVESRLTSFAQARRAFGRPGEETQPERDQP